MSNPTAKGRLITARFDGRCRNCGKAVPKGDNVYFAKHFGVRCEPCGPHTPDDGRLPSKRKGAPRPMPAATARPEIPSPAERTPATSYEPIPGVAGVEGRASRDADGVYRFTYGSVSEAVQSALTDYAQNGHNRDLIYKDLRASFNGRHEWGNRFTPKMLLDQLGNPSKHLLDAVDELRRNLFDDTDLPTAPRRKVRRGLEWGDDLDADRWLTRNPNAWDKSVREPQPRHAITIGCNLSIAGSATPDMLMYRGAAALALADYLTQQGCSVGITAIHAVRRITPEVDLQVETLVLKEPNMPLDIGAVAFAMCEVAFFRCAMVLGGARHVPGNADSGYEEVSNLPPADCAGIDYLIDADGLGKEAAEAWLKAQVAGVKQQSEAAYV